METTQALHRDSGALSLHDQNLRLILMTSSTLFTLSGGRVKLVPSKSYRHRLICCSWWRTIIWATSSVSLLGSDYYEKTLLYRVMRSQYVPLVVNIFFPPSLLRRHVGLFLFVVQNSARFRGFTSKSSVESWMQMMNIMTGSTARSSPFILPIDGLSFELVVTGFWSMDHIRSSIRGAFSIARGEHGCTFTRNWTCPWFQLTSLYVHLSL
ncbi:hypothetical protein L218DRAFT_300504 [Marasmius fiardii PR-910]|nr:hypothetical protein L218DRAFT_300504 [Marasmius fiardii PR-910]